MNPEEQVLEDEQGDTDNPTKKLRKSAKEMSEGSRSLARLKAFAKELSRSLEEPISSLNFLEEVRPSRIGSPFTTGLTGGRDDQSPARTLQEYYQLLTLNKNRDQNLLEITGKSKVEIREELEGAMGSIIESEYNFLGYRFLFELENFLRDLIQERIVFPNEKSITNYIPDRILDECRARKEIEESSPYSYGNYRWIDYSDFNDLKIILEKGKNRNHFKDILNDEQFKCVVSKLHELDPIRKKIAHSRSLTKQEFDRLSLYSEDISRLLGDMA